MRIQWIVRILGRILFYSLLFFLLVLVIYTLSHDQWLAGLISLIVFILVDEAHCSFTAGSTLVRLIAAEQEKVEKRAANMVYGGEGR